jgi:hypothetical protein
MLAPAQRQLLGGARRSLREAVCFETTLTLDDISHAAARHTLRFAKTYIFQ